MQFCSRVAENSQMGISGPSFEDEPRHVAEGTQPDGSLAWREPFLRRVMDEFEAGRLEPYEYTRCVLAINAATSTEEMAAVVERLSGDPSGAGAGRGEPVVRRQLDAVDLALLRAPRPSGAQAQTPRFVALAVVFVLFAVLILVGIWLATHVHAATSPGALVGGAIAAVSPAWL